MRRTRSETSPSADTELLAGRYALGPPIGRGRSTVYRARDTRLDRPVAIKEVWLVSEHEDHERVRSRALREAQAAARLNNPSVVTVFDVIEEEGSIWLVMELVDAPSLAQLVVDGGPLDDRRAAGIGLDVLGALEAAHAVGVVHRDVKPANVLVVEDGPAKLADFGVATIRDATRVTSSGLVVGSPAYMAPEQAMGRSVGPPADLWALGATLYFAVEGVPPFEGDSALATASAVVHGEPRPQRRPGPLSPVLHDLLAKHPDRRPTGSWVRPALTTIATDRRAEAALPPTVPFEPPTIPRPAGPATVPQEVGMRPDATARFRVPPPAPRPITERPQRPPERRGPSRWLVAVLLLVGLAVAAGLIMIRPGGGDGERSGTTAVPPRSEPDDTTATTERPTTTASTTTTTAEEETSLPAGWTLYEHPEAGYRIGYPPGWRVEPAGGPRIDFRDPATGRYLRVDWTNDPRPDPVADWEQQADGFAARHEGYEEIRIEPYDYRDYNAAMWEFRYRDGGAELHAANLGFVAGDQGYALLFQTTEDRWAASQDLYAQFRETFQPG